ncbi:GntR family transcriptional regulator [Amycolatopsis sp. QT-25]|uniref:GntR family transcriptional regulator n=1 Tax=Amycolatopsis sp. QT-25 TaxID=3034022 RepID=UPI0023EA7A05|nr:GntR family transcriptional regulator [Amycolatopsis sp. QT-25]WET81600.1 GntR family transcriptional regulator [Amycolatopsis sp. QT-25]
MPKYQEIADALRARIESGEYPIEGRLPGISALQEEFEVPGLNTIRAAIRILVEEGMVETRQGVGTFVLRATPVHAVDVKATLTQAQGLLATALAAMATPRSVTLDFDTEDTDTWVVLSSALRHWQNYLQGRADNTSDAGTRTEFLRFVALTESLAERVETAGAEVLRDRLSSGSPLDTEGEDVA